MTQYFEEKQANEFAGENYLNNVALEDSLFKDLNFNFLFARGNNLKRDLIDIERAYRVVRRLT